MGPQLRAALLSALQHRRPPLPRRGTARAALSTLPPASSSATTAAAASAHDSSLQTPPLAAPQGPPVATTASRCAPETARGRHVFTVAGHSLVGGRGAGRFVRSAAFAVGGYDWCVRYCPDGDVGAEGGGGYVSVFLALLTRDAEVRALFDLRLVDPATSALSPAVGSGAERLRVFDDMHSSWGFAAFAKRSYLEASPYLRDDCLTIHCDVTVITGTPLLPEPETTTTGARDIVQEEAEAPGGIRVPPSDDLLDSLRDLLQDKRMADVTIKVKGEAFHAHKLVLAMRSPVLEAQLHHHGMDGSMTVDDMEPAVFKALLHFIYTGSLPDDMYMDDLLEHSRKVEMAEMLKRLHNAALRYAMPRLKFMCESILCEKLGYVIVSACPPSV